MLTLSNRFIGSSDVACMIVFIVVKEERPFIPQ